MYRSGAGSWYAVLEHLNWNKKILPFDEKSHHPRGSLLSTDTPVEGDASQHWRQPSPANTATDPVAR
jgi:hypothetical protein